MFVDKLYKEGKGKNNININLRQRSQSVIQYKVFFVKLLVTLGDREASNMRPVTLLNFSLSIHIHDWWGTPTGVETVD